MNEPGSSSPAKPRQSRATTLEDIARHAGVSKVAASVVLNNARSNAGVSEAKRQRILDAAHELKYRPNALARSLFKRKTNIIAFYNGQGQLFDPLFPFFGAILQGILRGCRQHKKHCLIHGTMPDMNEDDVLQELLNGQIDGLVLYAREVTPLIEKLIDSHLPIVTIANSVLDIPCVSVDGEQGGQLLARYLNQKGYKDVLYRVTDQILPTNIELRWQGFREEASSLGMNVDLFYSDPQQVPHLHAERELIQSESKRPQVLANYNDFAADILVDLCDECGVRVPEDMAVTGFDGFGTHKRPSRRLTTIRAPWSEVGQQAIDLLMAQANGETVPTYTKIPVELLAGDTA